MFLIQYHLHAVLPCVHLRRLDKVVTWLHGAWLRTTPSNDGKKVNLLVMKPSCTAIAPSGSALLLRSCHQHITSLGPRLKHRHIGAWARF